MYELNGVTTQLSFTGPAAVLGPDGTPVLASYVFEEIAADSHSSRRTDLDAGFHVIRTTRPCASAVGTCVQSVDWESSRGGLAPMGLGWNRVLQAEGKLGGMYAGQPFALDVEVREEDGLKRLTVGENRLPQAFPRGAWQGVYWYDRDDPLPTKVALGPLADPSHQGRLLSIVRGDRLEPAAAFPAEPLPMPRPAAGLMFAGEDDLLRDLPYSPRTVVDELATADADAAARLAAGCVIDWAVNFGRQDTGLLGDASPEFRVGVSSGGETVTWYGSMHRDLFGAYRFELLRETPPAPGRDCAELAASPWPAVTFAQAQGRAADLLASTAGPVVLAFHLGGTTGVRAPAQGVHYYVVFVEPPEASKTQTGGGSSFDYLSVAFNASSGLLAGATVEDGGLDRIDRR